MNLHECFAITIRDFDRLTLPAPFSAGVPLTPHAHPSRKAANSVPGLLLAVAK
jgi:hypothetical protein